MIVAPHTHESWVFCSLWPCGSSQQSNVTPHELRFRSNGLTLNPPGQCSRVKRAKGLHSTGRHLSLVSVANPQHFTIHMQSLSYCNTKRACMEICTCKEKHAQSPLTLSSPQAPSFWQLLTKARNLWCWLFAVLAQCRCRMRTCTRHTNLSSQNVCLSDPLSCNKLAL